MDIATRIRTGDIASDLYRPIDFQGYWLATDAGRGVFTMIFRGIPPVLIGAVAFHLRVPTDAVTWVAFVISVWLGWAIAFAIRFAVSLAGFWLLDARGVWQITSLVAMFLAGFMVPLSFLPTALARAAAWLPFAGLASYQPRSSSAIANVFVAGVDRAAEHIRAGTFDSILLRPRGTILQLAAADIECKRVGRLLQASLVLLLALTRVDADWTLTRAIALLGLVLSGAAIYGGIWVMAAAIGSGLSTTHRSPTRSPTPATN